MIKHGRAGSLLYYHQKTATIMDMDMDIKASELV